MWDLTGFHSRCSSWQVALRRLGLLLVLNKGSVACLVNVDASTLQRHTSNQVKTKWAYSSYICETCPADAQKIHSLGLLLAMVDLVLLPGRSLAAIYHCQLQFSMVESGDPSGIFWWLGLWGRWSVLGISSVDIRKMKKWRKKVYVFLFCLT